MFIWRENSGGFHAAAVVINHPIGFDFKSEEDFSGNFRFQLYPCAKPLPAALWCQSQISLAAVAWQARNLLLHLAQKMAGQRYLNSLRKA